MTNALPTQVRQRMGQYDAIAGLSRKPYGLFERRIGMRREIGCDENVLVTHCLIGLLRHRDSFTNSG